jgi:chemotaxis protein MotB
MRVVGQSSTVLYDKTDPFNPTNRRISLVVMNKRTEEAILRDGKVVEADQAVDVAGQVAPAPVTPPAVPVPPSSH